MDLWVFTFILQFIGINSWAPTTITQELTCYGIALESYSYTSRTGQAWWFLVNVTFPNSVTFRSCWSDFDTQTRVYNSDGQDITGTYCDQYASGDCDNCVTYSTNSNGKVEEYTIPLNAGVYYLKVETESGDPVTDTLVYGEAYGCTLAPTTVPTDTPTTTQPTTSTPTTSTPTTSDPSKPPTSNPTTKIPTLIPITTAPSKYPTEIPTNNPITITQPPVTASPTKGPVTNLPTVTPIQSITTSLATSTSEQNEWWIEFQLIINKILGLLNIIENDSSFVPFCTETTKEAIWIQMSGTNAAADDIVESDFNVNILNITNNTVENGVIFDITIGSNKENVIIEIQNVLDNNIDDIIEYITNAIKDWLNSYGNGTNVDTTNMDIDITEITNNIDGVVIDTTSNTQLTSSVTDPADKRTDSSGFDTMLLVYIIGGTVLILTAIFVITCCTIRYLKPKDKGERKGTKSEMELGEKKGTGPTELYKVSSHSGVTGVSMDQFYIVGSGVQSDNSDNKILSDGINKYADTGNDGMVNKMQDDMSSDSDSEEIQRLTQQVNKIMDRNKYNEQQYIQRQLNIEKQQQQRQMDVPPPPPPMHIQQMKQYNNGIAPPAIMVPLPEPPKVELQPHHTARLSMDPNGVVNQLFADDQDEIAAYHEGGGGYVDDYNDDDDDDDDNGENNVLPPAPAQPYIPPDSLGDKYDYDD